MAQNKNTYIVIAQINDDDGYSIVVSASVEAKSRESAIEKASKENNYDPEDDMVQLCAVYEIKGTEVDISLT